MRAFGRCDAGMWMALGWAAMGGVSASAGPVRVLAGAGCSPTAEAAVARFVAHAEESASAEGFRVEALRTDALRGRAWAMVGRCEQPGAPLIAVPMIAGPMRLSVTPAASVAVVHAGDAVTVTAGGADSHMVLTGWAEGSGGISSHVRVRLPKLDAADGVPAARIACTVTGVGQVEVAR